VTLEPRARRALATAAAVFAAAFAVRAAHVFSFASRGFAPFESPSLDAAFYDRWARRILAGEWIGPDVFQGVPLYGYFLALVYSAFGTGPVAAALVQSALGALGVVFLYLFSRAAFSEGVALVAAALGAVSPALLLYESLRIGDGLAAAFTSAVLLASLALAEKPRPAAALGTGLLLGLATLARERFLLFAPVLLAILAVRHRRRTAPMPRPLLVPALLLAGLAVPLGFSLAHNLAAAGDPVLLSSSGGVNFFVGNRAGASGSFDPPPELGLARTELYARARAVAEEAEGRPLAASEVSSYWTRRGLREWGAASPIPLLARKLSYFWKRFEIPDVVDYDGACRASVVLSLPLPGFRVVGPLALIGLVCAFLLRRKSDAGLAVLLSLLGAHLAFLLLFFVTSRFRVSAVPCLLPLAGATVVYLAGAVRERRLGAAALALAGVAFAAVYVNTDRPEVALAAALNEATTHSNRGLVLFSEGKLAEAESELREAIRLRPDYAKSKYYLALVLERMGGRLGEAFEAAASAARDDPGSGRYRSLFGRLLIDYKKRPDVAIPELEAALRLDPGEAAAAFALGVAHQSLGDAARAVEWFGRAAAMGPELADECRRRIAALEGR